MTPNAHNGNPPPGPERHSQLIAAHFDPVSIKMAWQFMGNFLRVLLLLRGVMLLLLLLSLGGAVIIWAAEDVGLLDAVYFAAVTGLTVGYGDIVPCSWLGKLASVLIGIVGVVIMGILVAASVRALEFTLKAR